MESHFHSQIYRRGLAVQNRGFVLSLRYCLHCGGDQQWVAADRMHLDHVAVFIDNRFDDYDPLDA